MLDADKLLMTYWKPYMNKFSENALMDDFVSSFPAIEDFFKKCMNGKDWLSGHD